MLVFPRPLMLTCVRLRMLDLSVGLGVIRLRRRKCSSKYSTDVDRFCIPWCESLRARKDNIQHVEDQEQPHLEVEAVAMALHYLLSTFLLSTKTSLTSSTLCHHPTRNNYFQCSYDTCMKRVAALDEAC